VKFGAEVCGVGDVDGDGFEDAVISDDRDGTTQPQSGTSYLHYGGPDGLDTVAGQVFEPPQPAAAFGRCRRAGDLNGDGLDDIAIGAYRWDDTLADAGAVHVYYGDPSGPASTADWVLTGDQADGRCGAAVTGAGDLDGDGFGDLVIGCSRQEDPLLPVTNSGGVLVFYGSVTGLSGTSVTPADADESWYAGAVNSNAGARLAALGDIDGDGFSDFAVGAPNYTSSISNEGAVFLFRGDPAGLIGPTTWAGGLSGGSFGWDVGGAGDVDGDGVPELLVGASTWNSTGRAALHAGQESLVPAAIAVWDPTPPGQAQSFGHRATTVGDLDGDGYADVLITDPKRNNGQVDLGGLYVFGGGPLGLADDPDWTGFGSASDGRLGQGADGLGDINGDGFGDLAAGAVLSQGVQVFHGAADTPSDLSARSWDGLVASSGLGGTDRARSIGDVNGDGCADLALGSPYVDFGGTARGVVEVRLGTDNGPANTFTTLSGGQDDGTFGTSVSGGDVNGDGYGDVVAGAAGWDGPAVGGGAVFGWFGSPGGVLGPYNWSVKGNLAGGALGEAVAVVGDVDGDGYDDVVAGAPMWSNPEAGEGAVFLHLGSPDGPEAASWTYEADSASAGVGSMVSAAGDVNADGFADVLIGAPGWNEGFGGEGRALLFFGGAAGLSASPDRAFSGGTLDGQLGVAVAGIGDVNGDGYDDVAVSAAADLLEGGEAVTRVHLGDDVGPGLAPDAVFLHGVGVLPASLAGGDLNGDGYSDLVVGTTDASDGAFIWFGSGTGLAASPDHTIVPGAGAMGSAVDIADNNGDGFGDLLICDAMLSNPEPNEGSCYWRPGNADDGLVHPHRALPQATQTVSGDPVATGGTIATSGFTVSLGVRSFEGRRRGKLQAELKPAGVLFDGVLTAETPDWTDTGVDGVDLSLDLPGLEPSQAGHWRVRIAWDPSQNPRQRFSRWYAGDPRSPNGLHVRGWPDSDGDGVPDDGDCDAADPSVYPGALELCDGVDSNCDGSIVDTFDDFDLDLSPDCFDDDDDDDGSLDIDDCAPLDPAIHPGATELCDAVDDDCDGSLVGTHDDLDSDGAPDCIDDDDDGDGYIDILEGGTDCDDQHQGIHPGATEICDATDWNCDGDAEEGLNEDFDGDGFNSMASCSDATDCDDFDADVFLGQTEDCDGQDQDCDGIIDEGFDVDSDGFTTCQGDCNDNNSVVNPGATEECNGVDDDCDVDIDEGFDVDGDGSRTCDGDCNDADVTVSPAATETCNGTDDDCDGTIDEGFDQDADDVRTCGADGVLGTADDDCDDLDDGVAPGELEECDAVDEDCDGAIDEGFDLDLDGATTCGPDGIDGSIDDDCDDGNPTVFPGATEACDGADSDCDGVLPGDEADLDEDGYLSCDGCVDGFCGDCDDLTATTHPAAEELCNDDDDDCDGTEDDGLTFQSWWADGDGDGYGDALVPLPGDATCSDPGDGWANNSDDCDDDEGSAHPGGTEVSGNAIDEDCDGVAEGAPTGADALILAPGIACSAAGGSGGFGWWVLVLGAMWRSRRRVG
jgi:hypothetical protein